MTNVGHCALGTLAAKHLTPILYALEVCAVSMHEAGRSDEARYYRTLAQQLAEAAAEREEEAEAS